MENKQSLLLRNKQSLLLRNKIKTVINQLKEYKPKKIILFGSSVSGKLTPDSDLDIVLIKETNKPFHERLKEARMLLRTTIPVDIFVFTTEEFETTRISNPFVKEIAERGKVLYG